MTFNAGDLIVWNTYPDEIPLAVLQVRDAPAYDLDVVIAGYIRPGDTSIREVGFNTAMSADLVNQYFIIYEPPIVDEFQFQLNQLLVRKIISGVISDWIIWAVTGIDIASQNYELTEWQGSLTTKKKIVYRETVENQYVACQWQDEIWDCPYKIGDIVEYTPFDDLSKFRISNFIYIYINDSTYSFNLLAECIESVKGTHTIGTKYQFGLGTTGGGFDYHSQLSLVSDGDGDNSQLKWIIPVAIAGAAGLILLMKGKK